MTISGRLSPLNEAIEKDSPSTRLLTQEWLSPYRQSRLFLPVAPRDIQEYCIRFFISNRMKRNLCRVTLLCAPWMGPMAMAQKTEVTDLNVPILEVLPVIDLISGGSTYHMAFMMGSSGPYQKVSALIAHSDTAAKIFIKFAAKPSADYAIASEANWLTKLASLETMRDYVPALHEVGQLRNGRAFLITSVAPSLEPLSKFGSAHDQFLTALGHATQSHQFYGHSPEAAFIESTLHKLMGVFGRVAYEDLNSGWQTVMRTLATWRGPLVVAHRDFAPWNIRQSLHGIHVFDWEYAALGANPLHDYFHFHLIQVALSKHRHESIKGVRDLVSNASAYAQRTYTTTEWNNSVVTSLLLAYLLDVIIFYTDSGQLFDTEHPVLSTYIALIRSSSEWHQA